MAWDLSQQRRVINQEERGGKERKRDKRIGDRKREDARATVTVYVHTRERSLGKGINEWPWNVMDRREEGKKVVYIICIGCERDVGEH